MSKRIELKSLNVYYKAFLAVENVNMVIEPKAITAFIGPSGCGKSTLIRTLNRMHEVIPGARVEGQLLMDGEDVYGQTLIPFESAGKLEWCFSDQTHSPPCRSRTTFFPATN